jgi:hypothetical protein
MLLLVAILMGLTALAAGLAPPPPRGPQVRPSPTAGPYASGDAPVELRVDAAQEGAQSVAANAGDEVHLTVSYDDLATVELEGIGVVRPVSADSPAEFDVLATEGTYPIVLMESGRTVGTLEVTGSE